jgi:hypothetical protein
LKSGLGPAKTITESSWVHRYAAIVGTGGINSAGALSSVYFVSLVLIGDFVVLNVFLASDATCVVIRDAFLFIPFLARTWGINPSLSLAPQVLVPARGFAFRFSTQRPVRQAIRLISDSTPLSNQIHIPHSAFHIPHSTFHTHIPNLRTTKCFHPSPHVIPPEPPSFLAFTTSPIHSFLPNCQITNCPVTHPLQFLWPLAVSEMGSSRGPPISQFARQQWHFRGLGAGIGTDGADGWHCM